MPTAFSISLPSGVFDDLVNDLPTAPGSLPRMLVEVAYAEDVRPLDEREEGSEPEIVARTARQELSQVGTVVMNLGNPVNGSLLLSILKSDGSSVVQHAVSADDDEADYTVTSADVELLVQAEAMDMAQPTSVVNVRNAQLVPIGAVRPDFKSASFGVLTVNTGEEAMLGANGPLAAFGFAAGRSSSVELSAELASKLTDLTWRTVPLAVDGRFTAVFEQPILKEGTPPVSSLGWVWWLNGSRSAVGFVTDDVSAPNRRAIIVALPAMQPRPGDAAVEDDCDCHGGGKSVSLDVTEAELVNNPGVYSEDPGSFCKPFNNPERVVGEKAFAVVARVETPDISPVPSSKLRSQHLLDIDPEEPAEVKPDGRGGAIVVMKPPTKELMMTALMKKSRAVVRFKESAATVKETKEMPSGRTTMSADQPLQWEDDMAQYQAVTVAKGHILEFRVRTRSNGYSLGNVASTLTLAPRQTKRIQKVEFERMERARRDERTQQADSVSDDVTRERDYNDTVSAYLSEWATGSSSSSTAAAAGGIGFCIPPVVGGVGGGTSTAWSDSSQEGERNTGASEQQRLRDSIRRHGDALRRFQSSVVTEITQQETVTGTTEILRNPNYGHSLTVIYYQILRHLKVSTEFAGVRECLFVPFAIKPFTLQRAYRWREAIGKYLRVPRFKKALKHLRDVITDFEHSDIPDGPRKNQRLTYLRGSLYITLAIERPKDTAEGAYDAAQWLPFASFFGAPAFGIWSKLSARAAEMRDQFFQREHAPAMAAKWVNKLSVQVNGAPLQADFTLASRYGFNQTVRVDFSVAGSRADDFTRAQLTEIVVKAEAGLPPGSVANAKRMSLRFGTLQFERTIEAEAGVDDIVVPETGEVDTTGALMSFPLEAWDEVDERAAIKNAVNELVEHLNEHVEFYHKAIWWSMDRDRLMMMLDGFFVPGSNNQSIASVVDREPVAIIGNSLVYRVGAGSFLGIGNITKPAELYAQYAGREPAQDPLLISLPTDGLYAQTIMDECLALEEHQGSVDWVLNDPDPELGTIDPSLMMSRRADVSSTLTPTQMPTTIINLQNAPDAPAPTGLGAALSAVGNAGAFRDMAGLAGTQANAAAALQTAASLATNFGNQAAALKTAEIQSNAQATQNANQQIAAVESAQRRGLITPEQASEHANGILKRMHDAPSEERSTPITQEPAVQDALQRASRGEGGEINVSRTTPTGQEGVSMKFDGSSRSWILDPADANAWANSRSFGPKTNDKTGRTALTVRTRPIPEGGSTRWSVPPDERGKFTLSGGANVQSGLQANINGIRPGLTFIDFDVLDADGNSVESQKYPLCIPQFVRVRDSAEFDAMLTEFNLGDDIHKTAVLSEAKATCDGILSDANVRLIWTMAPMNEAMPAHLTQDMFTKVTINGAAPPDALSMAGLTVDRNSGEEFVGPDDFDEVINMFPRAFMAIGLSDIPDAVIRAINAGIAAPPLTSNPASELAVLVLGRALGATIAHEITHALLGAAFPGPDVAHTTTSGDIVQPGGNFTFEGLTGIQITDATNFPQEGTFVDLGIGQVDRPRANGSLGFIQVAFPVPPTFH